MHKTILTILLLLLSLLNLELLAQRGDPTLLRMGRHTGNRVGISFYNDGQIAGFNQGIDIRGEWPLGSGENYIGDCIPLIGVEFINTLGDTLHSVIISRGPRKGQSDERHPSKNYFWGWNPIPGFLNPNAETVAMSHLPNSWPIEGWNDPIASSWKDETGKTEWFGYFGRGIQNADQESLFDADDQSDDEFNFADPRTQLIRIFTPDSRDPSRNGMALKMRVRGFQWSNFLAEDAIFWLYDITNEGTTVYRKANFGTVVGTLAGGDGDAQDDLGYFDVDEWVTYSWDSDGIGNKGQKVGYVGYAFLESPGNPFDGIDNDDDSKSESPRFVQSDFDSVTYTVGSVVVLIDPQTYERTLHTITSLPDTVYSLGVRFIIEQGKYFREGHIGSIVNGVSVPHPSAYDGIDNDLDGLIDENQAIHYTARVLKGLPGLRYKNYRTGAGVNDLMIDERRDNDIDEDGDWDPEFDDVGIDGLGPDDFGYPGPDFGEGNGVPDQGEPNFGRTDPDESDQIGLTSFNFFNLTAAPDLSKDSLLWIRMTPGRFDVIPPIPQDGDFIYASGYFPLVPGNGNPDVKERFSVALLFGEDLDDIIGNKRIVQQIYNSGYKFPQPPKKPKITLTQEDGKVVIYWDGERTENDRDFITKKKDFQGYKIYRATDANFQDSRVVTNALGVLSFDKPIAQYDLVDTIQGFFYPSQKLLEQVGGTTFYLGSNTGLVNKFVDSSVVLGQTYYYAVCAYDEGDASKDIFPTENSKFIRRDNTGLIITDDNTGYITPGVRPAGYTPAAISDVQKSEPFIGTGVVNVEVVDDEAIKNNFKYKVAFQDSGAEGYTINWSLIDLQTPDTVFIPSINKEYIVAPLETIEIPSGNDTIYVNGLPFKLTGSTYTAPYDSLVARSKLFSGNTPIRHGFRLQILNDKVIKLDQTKSGFSNIVGTTGTITFDIMRDSRYPQNSGLTLPNDYSIEFYPEIADTSVEYRLFPPNNPANIFPATPVNFKIKNITQNRYIDFFFKKSGTVSTSYSIYFRDMVDTTVRNTWKLDLYYTSANTPLPTGGTLDLYTKKPFNGNDFLTFTTSGAMINKDRASSELDKIKVVPNPYVVTHQGESRLLSTQTSGRGEREIRFTYIPPGTKISIFTVRGELIKTLYHDDLYVGDVYWNLRTEENLDVAYGVYVFVAEVPEIGSKVGKFALIK
ncbi:MAG: hypothetical protein B6D44_05755 [Ignavibacteriales bacterium UTCHB2]|nr:MAG: hypothetical protein BWY38_00470 [Ignavibacteria bacterium ADurb.Bin266]OQY73892.1 MAG: hypothetical protein B6D44_05755 [Ignavibacteriales bacterium UTCHB2]HQI39884.1 hypothetical protein [Ignavibacteriaceae bacterium]